MSAENTVGLEGYARVSSLFGWFVILAMIVLAGVSLAVNPLLTLLTAIVCVSAFFLLGRIEVVVWLIVFLTPLETFLNVSFVHTKVIKLDPPQQEEGAYANNEPHHNLNPPQQEE